MKKSFTHHCGFLSTIRKCIRSGSFLRCLLYCLCSIYCHFFFGAKWKPYQGYWCGPEREDDKVGNKDSSKWSISFEWWVNKLKQFFPGGNCTISFRILSFFASHLFIVVKSSNISRLHSKSVLFSKYSAAMTSAQVQTPKLFK